MFRHTSRALKGSRIHGYSSNFKLKPLILSRNAAIVASSTAVVTTILYYYSSRKVIYNDFQISAPSIGEVTSITGENDQTGALVGIVFGSNESNVLSPETPNVDSIRTPSAAQWLENVALRDLALHETHAACVDACGDVYQWGERFSGSATETRKPTLTLRGKNITSLQLTESRVFALSASGQVYVLSASSTEQHGVPTTLASNSWWGTGWMWGAEEVVNFAEITPHEKLAWGETFISMSAGQDHLLALTSTGRTFAHPITKNANAYGQLGFHKFDIPDPSSAPPKTRLTVELIPKSVADPYSKVSAFTRPSVTKSENLVHVDNNNIKFCDKLFEIPALKGIEVSQVATGGRSSYARTASGKVLGWGANEYGQIGLGSNITLDTIAVPTEIVLWKTASSRTGSKCLDVSAGGDLACFTVQRVDGSSVKTIDFLLTGNGRWGGLGNNIYSNAQGTPVRAKNISGLLEYNDETRSLQPIPPNAISVSPTGHILLTLDNLGGRDLVVWGKNHDYELGNGKKSSLPIPTTLHQPDGERFMLRKIRAKEVRNLQGMVWRRGIQVEQRGIAGYRNSMIYWKIS